VKRFRKHLASGGAGGRTTKIRWLLVDATGHACRLEIAFRQPGRSAVWYVCWVGRDLSSRRNASSGLNLPESR